MEGGSDQAGDPSGAGETQRRGVLVAGAGQQKG